MPNEHTHTHTKTLAVLAALTGLQAPSPAQSTRPAATEAPATRPAATRPALTLDGDSRYNPATEMVQAAFRSPGYHTRIKSGSLVHPTLTAMSYALANLETSDPERHARASRIIAKLLTLQDTDPASRNYGTWPWMLEEPLSEMASGDLNWAAFIGARLTQALTLHADKIAPDVRDPMRTAIRIACKSIMKRNVGESYTNIAVMCFGVTCAAGELLDDAEIRAWGHDKLNRFADYTAKHGGFTEYNSPTYIPVSVREIERLLLLVRDPSTRQRAEALRRLLWQSIAEHYHPGTAQWAGPHARVYNDLLDAGNAQMIADATGLTIGTAVPRRIGPGQAQPASLPCPEELVSRFKALPSDPLVVVSQFRADTDERRTLVGTTWMTQEACLGSINRDTLWTQRRPLLGYWKLPEGTAPAILRARFLKDGKDFASAAIITSQQGERTASAFRLIEGSGDWHISLDRPKDRTFSAADLRVRIELTAAGAAARELRPGVYELSTGNWKAVLHTATGSLAEDGSPLRWELGRETGSTPRVWLDGIYRTSPTASPLPLTASRDRIAGLGLELLPVSVTPATNTPVLSPDGRVTWNPGTTLQTPRP